MTTLDLQAVDDLCRLALAARRLNCHIHLAGADSELRSLLELAGVDDVLIECPAAADSPARPVPTGGDLP